MNRRDFLVALAAVPVAAGLPGTASAAADVEASPEVIGAARLLTARADLPEVVIARARTYQAEAIEGFGPRLDALVASLAKIGDADREAVIAALSEEEARTAVDLVAPLYLGFTGSPSTVKADDGAKFVTFLDALMYDMTAATLTRPSYARGGPNYWVAVPAGVDAPEMDPDIAEWGARSPRAARTIARPDPRYLAMCQGHGKTLKEAEEWLANNELKTSVGTFG